MLGSLHCHARLHDQSFFSCELEQDEGAMHTGATGFDLTTLGIQVAELIKRGIRLGLHECRDDLPPLGINPRRIATSMGVRSITPGPAKTRDEFSHEPRADGKTLG